MPNKNTSLLISFSLICFSFVLAFIETPYRALWPSFTAIVIALMSRRAFVGLLSGAAAGAIILSGGNPLKAFTSLFYDHLVKMLQSEWKISAIVFTLILGGFVALIEEGGGLKSFALKILNRGKDLKKQLQWCVLSMGLICFFDGLANSLMVGRLFSSLADKYGVSRAKLAYIVDSTSSSVACLAFISTWIAYQLSMIIEGFERAGMSTKPYILFFQSIPYNFYCWFTIILLPVMIIKNFNPGPMKELEDAAGDGLDLSITNKSDEIENKKNIIPAVIPVIVLIVTLFIGLYLDGAETIFPITVKGLAEAFGNSNAAIVLIYASIVAALVAFILYPRSKGGHTPSNIFEHGTKSFFTPILILIAAWMLSSTLGELKAGEVLSGLLAERLPLWLLPTLVFLIGSLISFSTGTSWGTMGILMPLTIPVVFNLTGDSTVETQQLILAACVGAVFSGAVFGDHCSPISDTTIVSSISCQIEPHDHVRTQMPYALIAAIIAVVFGFIPVGLGLPVWISLLGGLVTLWFIPNLFSLIKK